MAFALNHKLGFAMRPEILSYAMLLAPFSIFAAAALLWLFVRWDRGYQPAGDHLLFPIPDGGSEPATNIDTPTQTVPNQTREPGGVWPDIAPNPIWLVDEADNLTWTNSAYTELLASLANASDIKPFHEISPLRKGSDQIKQLVNLGDGAPSERPLWFEVTSKRCGEGILHFAIDASATVAAENAQRDFVQTMTKTFAHLSTGLAIFNRKRELNLFNPALLDLTHLPADFLSRRPTLHAFLDNLRENRMIPEPKDYATWRNQIVALETGAQKGTYSELWPLAGGTTYRVTGRPYPDGAVAFLFEDISAEMSMTEQFQSELRLGQSILDGLEGAIAVFSSTGQLLRVNKSYHLLWSIERNSSTAEDRIHDCVRLWQENSHPSPVWSDIRDFVLTFEDRAEWEETTQHLNGSEQRCRCTPLPGGATLVSFTECAMAGSSLMLSDQITEEPDAKIA